MIKLLGLKTLVKLSFNGLSKWTPKQFAMGVGIFQPTITLKSNRENQINASDVIVLVENWPKLKNHFLDPYAGFFAI